ncbi:hypothetical protein EV215_0535 [Hypnocyclicus thermotrophus]|uniref:Uncharacterized protein n=1 Tax=Hypnocyclicus thermotrophus TaxID=1627895 RepID=A0AA46DZK8_9FUSO|nr:hypothetical protein [Hypnocyclicus thermotrophus]TDT71845.1 hypothetical protein EV215_0535 [Hypnocyclicus thermotrophus]
MKKFFLKLIIIFIIIFNTIFANNYHIGDIIRLEIKNSNIKEVKNVFKDFDIEKIEEKNNKIYIEFRSFETGEKDIILGDKKLILNIDSTIKKDETKLYNFNNNKNLKLQKIYKHFEYYIFYLIFILNIGLLIKIFIKQKNKENEIDINEIIEKENDFRKINYEFKKYIDKKYNTRFLNGIYNNNFNKEIENYLKNIDDLIFQGKTINIEEYKNKVLKYINIIKEKKNV